MLVDETIDQLKDEPKSYPTLKPQSEVTCWNEERKLSPS